MSVNLVSICNLTHLISGNSKELKSIELATIQGCETQTKKSKYISKLSILGNQVVFRQISVRNKPSLATHIKVK